MTGPDDVRAPRGSSIPRRLFCAAVALVLALGAPRAEAACPAGEVASAYASARRAFEGKRFDEAVALLHRAYECDPNPVYLGNIARAYEEATRPADALAAWQAYLEVTTDPDERQRTQGRISALAKVVADRERLERERIQADEARRRAEALVHAQLPLKPSPTSRPPIDAAAWVTAGAGAAGLIAAGALGLVAEAKHSSAVADSSVTGAVDLQNSAKSFASAANVAFVAGGVLAAVGVIWIGVDLLRPAPARQERVGLVLSPWGVSLVGAL